ncbi:MAG: hypothetical protein IKS85_09725 [Lachnospiraceae bacterium]|nr:hypothetical protein [Lachnospiraceae bacterium]
MKRFRRICMICLVMAFLTGCGKEKVDPQIVMDAQTTAGIDQIGQEQTYIEQSSEVSTALMLADRKVREAIGKSSMPEVVMSEDGGMVSSDDAEDQEPAGQAAQESEGETPDGLEDAEQEPEVLRELTEQELKKLQWSIRGSDNGFFVSTYYRPEEIDWQEVFYNGAGMRITLSDDQVALIREKLRADRLEEERLKAEMMGLNVEEEEEDQEPAEEPFTEEELALNAGQITALTLRSIQSFVKSRTGLEYSEARKPLEWPELSRNLFYFIHDDSNAIRVEFMSGTVCGNLYEIYYRRARWASEKKPEYVMRVEIENGKWKFLSNLPIDETAPVTLADIEFYSSKELARMQNPVMLIDVPEVEDEADYYEEELGLKPAAEPTYYWAMITALEDNTKLSIDRVYQGDEISRELQTQKRIYIPGENLNTVTLNKGEKIGIKVSLEDSPKIRVRATWGRYNGDYAFGSENRLKRFTKEGLPLPTYLYGRDVDGERRGTVFTSESELLRFLEGTWVFYDSEMGMYTASVTFDLTGGMVIDTLGVRYVLQISGFDRIYTDARSDPPDLIKLKSTDEETLEIFKQYYSFLIRKVGDYHVRAVQRDGVQLLLLSFENNGKDGLSYLLPDADLLADEIVLYRFVGTEITEE